MQTSAFSPGALAWPGDGSCVALGTASVGGNDARDAFEAGGPVCLLAGGDYCWLQLHKSPFIGFPLFSDCTFPW